MDTRFFGDNLIALNEIQDERRRLSTEATEDAYYKQFTPADGRFLRIASVIAGVWFTFSAIGFWLR
jgi:hypothetical protein